MKPNAATVALAVVAVGAAVAQGADAPSQPALPSVPPRFSVELAAGPPLVERPIAASFDDEGRLYVTESSGSNEPVAKQLEERPHRIVRLEDTDGDGRFDRRVVFADRMMWLQGALFWRGSLYVAAPPSIWKLTDTNGDGTADERVEWYQGKTLTGCANDLHGPYLGPEGWLYWCKGAFAEQTHVVQNREWKSRAAHVFRSRPDGSGLEPVITGGMDNPVGLAFRTDGERILSATYLQGSGRRDGLVHAIYGGVYGKQHGVLDGHPRTGELMPALVLMSAAAPCGLERYDSQVFGAAFRDNVFLCQFNLRKVSRHVLAPAGSTFASADSDFLVSEDVDFHPTDVLMDADGSLLVVDTGGWYKLCCPTSTLAKPDVLGGIYRVRRRGAHPPADPRGKGYVWPKLTIEDLWSLLADERPAVRQRALNEFANRRHTHEVHAFVQSLRQLPPDSGRLVPDAKHLTRAWALVQLETADSRACVRRLLDHPDEQVRHVALAAASLLRDAGAFRQIIERLADDTTANRRIAAEALGRIGERTAVGKLLEAAANADDRILQHSITYALIEIADAAATRAGLASDAPGTLCTALVALDQMPGGGIEPQQAIGLLSSTDERSRDTARWLVTQHSEWGSELAAWFGQRLAALPDRPQTAAAEKSDLEAMLVGFAADPAIQQLLADVVLRGGSPLAARELALRVMCGAKLREPPAAWRAAAASALAEPRLLEPALAAASVLPPKSAPDDALTAALVAVADSPRLAAEVRAAALAAAAPALPALSDAQFELLLQSLSEEDALRLRTAAAEGLSKARLTAAQLQRLCGGFKLARPLEINRLIAPFARASDERLGMTLIAALQQSPAVTSLRFDVVRDVVAGYGPAVHKAVDELESQVHVDAAGQRARLEALLPRMAQGDVRRGHAVFYNAKAACSACHRLGHAGGTIGPELTRIGESRTERDLLESILYPSLSFVRGYEPVLITTVDGRVINGTLRDETASEYFLATGPDEEIRIRRNDIEQMEPSAVSIMPAGLDQQLTLEQLADLVAFLKNATDKRPTQQAPLPNQPAAQR
jgi:putative membrane-bound dehydrogenase-like protein